MDQNQNQTKIVKEYLAEKAIVSGDVEANTKSLREVLDILAAPSDNTIDSTNDLKNYISTVQEQLYDLVGLKNNTSNFDEARKRFIKRYNEAGIVWDDSSRNTIKNWLQGKTSPQGEQNNNTEHIINIFFAFFNKPGGTEKECYEAINKCQEFSCKTFFASAFDYRDIRDIVAYYCIGKGYTYKKYTEVFEECKNIYAEYQENKEEKTTHNNIVATISIESIFDYDKLNNDTDLYTHIRDYIEQFDFELTTAKQEILKLYDLVKPICDKMYKVDNNESIDINDYALLGVLDEDDKLPQRPIEINKDFNRYILKNLPNEASFKKNFSEILNRDEMRKILLFFFFFKYSYCMDNESEESKQIYRDPKEKENRFISYANYLLVECGLPKMYERNPYDFMLIYASGSNNPIQVFRKLYLSITNNWPEETEDRLFARLTKDSPNYILTAILGVTHSRAKKNLKRKK